MSGCIRRTHEKSSRITKYTLHIRTMRYLVFMSFYSCISMIVMPRIKTDINKKNAERFLKMKRVCVSAMRRIIHFDNNVMKKGCSKKCGLYAHKSILSKYYLRSYGSSKNLELIHELT